MSTITYSDSTPTVPTDQRVDLAIEGMTCASCASRIERRLNKLDGVTATVNYATEKAQVTFADDIEPAQLIAEVEAAGYSARLPEASGPDGPDPDAGSDDPTRRLRDRLVISTLLTVPVGPRRQQDA